MKCWCNCKGGPFIKSFITCIHGVFDFDGCSYYLDVNMTSVLLLCFTKMCIFDVSDTVEFGTARYQHCAQQRIMDL